MTPTILTRSRTWIAAPLAAFAISLLLMACGHPDERNAAADSVSCGLIEQSPIWSRDRSATLLSDDPADLTETSVLVVSIERPDLDCDGHSDLVTQTREGFDSTAGGLWLRGFYRRDGAWVAAFRFRSSVEGPSGVVVAFDLNGDSRLDVLLLGRDEGGIVPQLLLSRGDGYIPGHMADAYRLRNESEWPSSCWSRLAPAIVSGGRIRLARETISPLSARGHGADCSLPLDTLELRGDSLIRVQ